MHGVESRAIFERAVAAHKGGRLDEAQPLYRQILQGDPDDPDALHLLGVLHHQRGERGVAIDLVERAIAIRPLEAKYYSNLGEIYRSDGKLKQSLAAQQRAIGLKPDLAEARLNLGLVLEDLCRFHEAASSYAEAIKLRGNYLAAWICFARACLQDGLLDHAALGARRALQLNPQSAEAHQILGAALATAGRAVAAEEALRQALALDAGRADAWAQLAEPLRELGRADEAIASLQRAIELDSTDANYYSRLLFVMHESPRIVSQPDQLAAAHRDWAARHSSKFKPPTFQFRGDRSPSRRLRIGYVSPDFRQHAVMHFFEPILRAHDRDEFEFLCYANCGKRDAVTHRLIPLARSWRDIFGMPDEDVAELIRADGIDVLVDLAGHTSGNRLLVFARKPAPLQFTYLGYPDTTGMDAIDYRFTDRYVDPPSEEMDGRYAEKLLRLDDSFLCYNPPHLDDPDTLPASTDRPLTFACFNRGAKINDDVIAAWSTILLALPGSRLLLKGMTAGEPAAQEQRRAQFASNGVDPTRIEFPPPVIAHSDHLREYEQVDIALDCWPYNGTTTTCEALYMGVPVIALEGNIHVSRVGMSILSNAGFPELIAPDVAGYIRLALELAADERRRNDLRGNLRPRMLCSALMDARRITRNIEQAYRHAWLDWSQR